MFFTPRNTRCSADVNKIKGVGDVLSGRDDVDGIIKGMGSNAAPHVDSVCLFSSVTGPI